MSSICIHCKEEAFDNDEQVCKACGVVGDEVKYCPDYNLTHTFVHFKKESRKSKPNALDHGIETVDFLCHRFNISGDVKMETVSLLKNVHDHQRKIGKCYRLKEDVGVLAGCCLLNIQKKYKCPIPVLSLCSNLKCHKKKLIKMMKVLTSYFVEQSAIDCTESMNNAVEELDDSLEFLDSYVAKLLSSVDDQIKEELIKKTIAMVRLSDSCWILSGRPRMGVIVASAYLCWRSMHPHWKLSLPKFCSMFSLNATKARTRLTELKSMLLKLGTKIPSVTQNYVNEKNILFHLSYILENSESLRNDLLTNECTADEINLKEYELYRREFTKNEPVFHSASVTDDINASDVEISDTEISSYIRSDEQIQLIKNLRKSRKSQEL